MTFDPMRFGQHDAQLQSLDRRLESVEAYVQDMNGKLDQLLLQNAENKGERKVAGWLGGTIAGSVMSLIVAWITGKLHQ